MLIKMLQIIIKLTGVILVLLGIVFIYDARILTKRFFGFGDQNDASQRFENIGFFYSDDWWIDSVLQSIICIKNILTNKIKIC